jgi:hypothetical protein
VPLQTQNLEILHIQISQKSPSGKNATHHLLLTQIRGILHIEILKTKKNKS